jgi:hypothetical protein
MTAREETVNEALPHYSPSNDLEKNGDSHFTEHDAASPTDIILHPNLSGSNSDAEIDWAVENKGQMPYDRPACPTPEYDSGLPRGDITSPGPREDDTTISSHKNKSNSGINGTSRERILNRSGSGCSSSHSSTSPPPPSKITAHISSTVSAKKNLKYPTAKNVRQDQAKHQIHTITTTSKNKNK